MRITNLFPALLVLGLPGASARAPTTDDLNKISSTVTYSSWTESHNNNPFAAPRPPIKRPKECPPCFNCQLPAFNCAQFGECNSFNGQCICPDGWGGVDCLTPLCGSLADPGARYPRPDGEDCKCQQGWSGINCNVCQTDKACAPLKTRWMDDGGGDGQSGKNGDDGEDDSGLICYKGGLAVEQNYQMCDVTNRKIIDTIPDNKKPQVTFSCKQGPSGNISTGGLSTSSYQHPLLGSLQSIDRGDNTQDDSDPSKGTCSFQFWVDRIESFYCKLDDCEWEGRGSYESNTTFYQCKTIECACVADRFLCGQDGSVNIDDFLTEEVKGPATFRCENGAGCAFKEPAMNQLINDIFGDESITLDCDSGECMHYTQVPGYTAPEPPNDRVWVALSAASAALVFLLAALLLWYFGRSKKHPRGFGGVELPEDEASKLMADHIPATLHFENITYSVGTKAVLTDVTGSVAPGQIMAVMGASGAGKSTLLDILARKTKRGRVGGNLYINGKQIDDDRLYQRIVGFVDQEDTLMPTLTVYETVLYSALLRLPKNMSTEAKKFRTLETLNELGLLGIKNSRIGEAGRRSISGGEKRRVSIACELVTSPSILFLDEPTSGKSSLSLFRSGANL